MFTSCTSYFTDSTITNLLIKLFLLRNCVIHKYLNCCQMIDGIWQAPVWLVMLIMRLSCLQADRHVFPVWQTLCGTKYFGASRPLHSERRKWTELNWTGQFSSVQLHRSLWVSLQQAATPRNKKIGERRKFFTVARCCDSIPPCSHSPKFMSWRNSPRHLLTKVNKVKDDNW
jgi:hypothetical protein